MTYPVIFTETGDERGTVLVSIPDLRQATEGFGIDDAIAMARDCIGTYLADEDDSEIPDASSISTIDVSKSEFADAGRSFVSLVDVDIDFFRRKLKSRSVRRNITLPEWLDEMATKAKINVSAVVQDALKKTLGISESRTASA